MLALVEHTNFVSKENFGGDHIVYAGDYLELGHEYFSMSDDELLERFIPAFQKFNPEFQARLGEEDLGVQNKLCPACAVGESFKEYPCDPNTDRRLVFRFDEPGLSVGPGNEFRGGDRKKSREDDEVNKKATRLSRLFVYCPRPCGYGLQLHRLINFVVSPPYTWIGIIKLVLGSAYAPSRL